MTSLTNETVLVTGAGGFIGSHLVEALVKRGATVRAMVHYNCRNSWGHLDSLPQKLRSAIEVLPGDITDPFFVRQAVKGTHAVFNLAALIGIPYSYIAPQQYLQVNVQGTLNVLEACRSEDVVKMVQTSTSETYGTARYAPIDEQHPLQGQSPYSASKIASDKMAESYHLSFGLPVATVRPFNAYGPRQSARAVIPAIISQALAYKSTGEPIRLGSLTPRRDFTYVQDTVEGFIRMAECDASVGEVVNIGTGQTQTIGETVALVLELMGQPDILVVTDDQRIRPAKSEVGLLLADASKAKRLLDWEPTYSFREGLEETIEAIQKDQLLMSSKTGKYTV